MEKQRKSNNLDGSGPSSLMQLLRMSILRRMLRKAAKEAMGGTGAGWVRKGTREQNRGVAGPHQEFLETQGAATRRPPMSVVKAVICPRHKKRRECDCHSNEIRQHLVRPALCRVSGGGEYTKDEHEYCETIKQA